MKHQSVSVLVCHLWIYMIFIRKLTNSWSLCLVSVLISVILHVGVIAKTCADFLCLCVLLYDWSLKARSIIIVFIMCRHAQACREWSIILLILSVHLWNFGIVSKHLRYRQTVTLVFAHYIQLWKIMGRGACNSGGLGKTNFG